MTALADMVIGHIEHRLDARADRAKMRVDAERHLRGFRHSASITTARSL